MTLAAAAGRRLHTDSALLAAALARFVAAYPGSASVDDLVQALPAAARSGDGRALVREGLLNMVVNGLATARLDAMTAVARPGRMPVACPMARADAARGAATTVNLRHERVALDGLAQTVLPLLDGSRDAQAISAALVQGGRDGPLAFTHDGAAAEDPDERMRIVSDNIQALLPTLASAALLLA